MYSLAQSDVKNLQEETDEYLITAQANPSYCVGSWYITDAIYKAIDSRFIANKYGVMREEKRITFSDKRRIMIKSFSIFIYDQVFPSRDRDHSPISGGHKKWDYYINDRVMYDGRALISTIIPQAIESVDFTPPSPKLDVPKGLHKSAYNNRGVVRFYTRDISKSTIDDHATVYLLNDNQVITQKIFDAINPVFIRSLKRITNPEELADYGYKEKTEIVKIELFELNDLTEAILLSTNDCPKCEIILVDNIQIDWKIYQAIYIFNIKEIREICEDEKEAFAPYRKLFTKEKLQGTKRITVISL